MRLFRFFFFLWFLFPDLSHAMPLHAEGSVQYGAYGGSSGSTSGGHSGHSGPYSGGWVGPPPMAAQPSPQARAQAQRQQAERAQKAAEDERDRVFRQEYEEHKRIAAEIDRRREADYQAELARQAHRDLVTYTETHRNQTYLETEATRPFVPQIIPRVTYETSQRLYEELSWLDSLADQSVVLANNGERPSVVRLMSDFALDAAHGMHSYVVSVGEGARGFYWGMLTGSQVTWNTIRTVYRHPTLVMNLSHNIMQTLTGRPLENLRELGGRLAKAQATLYWGSAFDRGVVLGSVAHDVLLSAAFGGALQQSTALMRGISTRFNVPASPQLGRQLLLDAPKVPPIQAVITETIEAKRVEAKTHQYHRVMSRYRDVQNQSGDVMVDILRSNELWGQAPRIAAGSGDASVKAYFGPLPEGAIGFEFETDVIPGSIGSGQPGAIVKWYEGAEGVSTVEGQDEFVKIPVRVIKNTQVSLWPRR